MSYALSIDGITKSYGSVMAVSELDLRIAPGERVALIGASGSGKSTLIRLASGLLISDCGEVKVFGEAIQRNGALTKDARRIRRQIGLIFQKFNLVNRLSVMTNVLVGSLGRISPLRGTLGLYAREDREAAYAALAQVGIEKHAFKRAEALSGGQQQRAAIARALAMQPKVMLFDEPTSALDPEMISEVLDVMLGLAADGMTMIVVTHEMGFARSAAQRVVFLDHGQIVEVAPPEQFFTAPSSDRAQDFLAKILDH